jgi:hypothetical protein
VNCFNQKLDRVPYARAYDESKLATHPGVGTKTRGILQFKVLKAEYLAKRKIISGLLLGLAHDQWLLQYTSFQKYCTGPPVGEKSYQTLCSKSWTHPMMLPVISLIGDAQRVGAQ